MPFLSGAPPPPLPKKNPGSSPGFVIGQVSSFSQLFNIIPQINQHNLTNLREDNKDYTVAQKQQKGNGNAHCSRNFMNIHVLGNEV